MQKPITAIPGYCVFEYLLVVLPHQELCSQLQLIQKEFALAYKAPQASHTKPNLPLVNFYGYEMTQEKIMNRIGTIAAGVAPFKIELTGFGSFPSHTIYAKVATKIPVQHVVKELKQAKQLMTLNKENQPHYLEEPHITICRKLKPWQFEKAWLAYSHRHFSARFIADSLVLLKRPAGEKGYYPVMRFEFKNLPLNTRQASLFSPMPPGGGNLVQ